MVLADGCFDPLHVGHIRYLAEAASLGPVMVRVAPDSAITAKGRIPFQSQEERARTLAALRMVDGFVCHLTLEDAIRELHPTYLVKGDDWRGLLSASILEACEETGATIVFTQTQERTSSERWAG